VPSRDRVLQFGKYEVVEAIGSGGMATVYRARLPGPMGFEKPVAVKVLLEDAASDPDLVRMFVDEARLGARLNHPNIAHVLEFGEADGRYYLAMEYVDGVSLSRLLKPGGRRRKARGLPVAAAASVADQVLRALAYAHGLTQGSEPAGVIHRDVSPQNVLVDRSGTVKVCDFGIATGPWREERTRTGVVKGKVGYMAPEQAAGSRVGPQADLYSVGLLLVAMLEGGHPFEGSDTEEIRRKARQGLDPDRIARLPGGDALREVIATALAPRPKERFQTAEEMRRAIREAVPDREEAGVVHLAQAVQEAAEAPARAGRRSRKATAARTAVPAAGEDREEKAPAGSGALPWLVIGAGLVLAAALVMALFGWSLPR